MKLITDNLLPERWEKSRTPPSAAELKSTSILRVRVSSASAKIRVGGPSEDRADLKNTQLVRDTWTGVVRTPSPITLIHSLPPSRHSFDVEG